MTAALDVAIAHGFSRLPVFAEGGDDDVVGLAYTKDLMRAERNGAGTRSGHRLRASRTLHPGEQAGESVDARDAGREVPPRVGGRRVRRVGRA